MQSRNFTTNRHVRPTERTRTRPGMQVPKEVVVLQGGSSPMNMASPDKSRRRLNCEYLDDDDEGSSIGGEQSQELLLPPALRSIVTPTNASNSSNVSNASGNRMNMLASAASEWMQLSSVCG